MNLPTIGNYGKYSNGNYGAHTLVVDFGTLTVWFSYQTAVAFQVNGKDRVVRENSWGPTTGKHLSWIEPDKRKRVSAEKFEELWQKQVQPALKRLGKVA